MDRIRIAIFGAGGMGREIAWVIDEANKSKEQYEFVGFIDDAPISGQSINGHPVLTPAQMAAEFPDVHVVVGVGDPSTRERLVKRIAGAGLVFANVIHPSVIHSPSVTFSAGSVVCGGCVLTTNIVIGPHVHMNLNSTIGHDTVVGDCSSIGPGVNIAGFVRIGKRVFIGAGAVIINGTPDHPLIIEDDVMIGAGSCVISSLHAGSHVFGNPARPIPTPESRR